MKAKLLIIIFGLLLSANLIYSAEISNQSSESNSNGSSSISPINEERSNYNQRRYFHKGMKLHGVGILGGVGYGKFYGDVNFEEINGQSAIDTVKNDTKLGLTTFSAGLRYAYLEYSKFVWIGFSFDVLYQRFGLQIDNRYSYNGGVLSVGENENLILDYLIFKPSFHFYFLSLGVYAGVLIDSRMAGKSVSYAFKKYDIGISLAFDITLPIPYLKNAMSMIFEGVFGLVNIGENSTRLMRNIGFYFKMGFIFNFTKDTVPDNYNN